MLCSFTRIDFFKAELIFLRNIRYLRKTRRWIWENLSRKTLSARLACGSGTSRGENGDKTKNIIKTENFGEIQPYFLKYAQIKTEVLSISIPPIFFVWFCQNTEAGANGFWAEIVGWRGINVQEYVERGNGDRKWKPIKRKKTAGFQP